MSRTHDPELDAVADELMGIREFESRVATVLRDTLDQLYDGQRTGRYKWDQLHKTEKTHCGTLVEINMQREFKFTDGDKLDFKIADIEVDCKYSQRLGGWMIPVEARGELCMVIWADDGKSVWTMGLVRALKEMLTKGGNRDRKASLSQAGMSTVRWLLGPPLFFEDLRVDAALRACSEPMRLLRISLIRSRSPTLLPISRCAQRRSQSAPGWWG